MWLMIFDLYHVGRDLEPEVTGSWTVLQSFSPILCKTWFCQGVCSWLLNLVVVYWIVFKFVGGADPH